MTTSAKKALIVHASRTEVSVAVREWWRSLDMEKMEVTLDDLPRRFDVAFRVKEGSSFILPSVKVLTYIILEDGPRDGAEKGPDPKKKGGKGKGKNVGEDTGPAKVTRVTCEALLPEPIVGINGVRYLKLSICWLKRYFMTKGMKVELSSGLFEQRVRCD